MSFIPSIFRSVPQVIDINAGVGSYVITSVDVTLTELSIGGYADPNSGGTVSANGLRVTLTDATHITVAGGSGGSYVTVREYNRPFLIQAVSYGTVTIAIGGTTISTAHGLTLGAKAYLINLGNTSDRAADGGLALAESQVKAKIRLNGANVQATVITANYAGAPGTVIVGYCIVDPK